MKAEKSIMEYKYYRIENVMEQFDVTRNMLYRLMKEKGVDPIKISHRTVRLREDQIEKLFNTINQ